MAPKRAHPKAKKSVTQEDFHTLNEIWKVAQRHGMDAALQKLVGEPALQHEGRASKRQRTVPVHFREGQQDSRRSQTEAVATVGG